MHRDNDLAFLVYSSGTTGLPKGVMLSHGNIMADVLQVYGAVGKSYTSGKDKILGVLPFFHIYGFNSILNNNMKNGMHIITLPKFTPEHYLQCLLKFKVSFQSKLS